MGERVRLATGRGPLGTGVFLLGRRLLAGEEWQARSWFCLLFVPVVPLRRARFWGDWAGEAGVAWEVVCEPATGASSGDLARTVAGTVAALGLGLGPAWYAWTKIHQTGLLEALFVVIGVAAPVLVAMWRDVGTPRVLR